MSDPHVVEDQSAVAAFLADPATHGGAAVERIDTHGAMVFLAGDRAYKVKRAVRYPYMDFSTLARREAACRAELALNRRTAPHLYLAAEPIRRDAAGRLALGAGPGAPVEWCVAMRRFRQEDLFDRMAERGALDAGHIEALAEEIAGFHAEAERHSESGAAAMRWVVEENIEELREKPELFAADRVDALETAARAAFERTAPLLDDRAASGFVRRCHGDLHLRNVVLVEGRPTIFDAIEFNDALAVTDVCYDLAFLLMDLDHCRLRPLGNRVLNRYLERTGDIEGLATLPLFLSTRAAVRAKVSASIADTMAAADPDAAGVATFRRLAVDYLAMAIDYLRPPPARLVAVGGLSGTGKTTVARLLAPDLGPAPGAVVLRSDVIRKRRFGVAETDRLPAPAYAPEVSRDVYAELKAGAAAVVAAGHAAIADAVFAKAEERAAIAAAGGARFAGLWLDAPRPVLERRVAGRSADASDADAAVVALQSGFDIGQMTWPTVDADAPPETVAARARTVLAAVPEQAPAPVDAGQ